MLELHLGPMENDKGAKRWGAKEPTAENTDQNLWFEQAIAEALSGGGYETLWGVHNSINNVDIDVTLGYRNQIGIIEAKTSDKDEIGNLKGFHQLITAMHYLNATYIKPFLVLSAKSGDSLAKMCQLFGISIISLPHYKRGSTSLSYEDREKLLAEVDKVMRED